MQGNYVRDEDCVVVNCEGVDKKMLPVCVWQNSPLITWITTQQVWLRREERAMISRSQQVT